MSDLVKEGFSQGGILPTTVIVDLLDATTARPRVTDGTWKDVVTNTSYALTTAGFLAVAQAHNSSPQKMALSGTGINLAVPGVYKGRLTLEMFSSVGTTEVGVAIVESADSPTTFYEDDAIGDASRILAIDEIRPYSRDFLVDISVPTVIQIVLIERGGTSGQLKTRGGQISLERISKYSAVTRS